jgi:hypothetical protein
LWSFRSFGLDDTHGWVFVTVPYILTLLVKVTPFFLNTGPRDSAICWLATHPAHVWFAHPASPPVDIFSEKEEWQGDARVKDGEREQDGEGEQSQCKGASEGREKWGC